MPTKSIVVLAATDQDSLATRGADVEDTQCLTLTEAKRRARYYLTDEYMQVSECSQRLGYSQVLLNGICVADFFFAPPTPAKRRTPAAGQL